MADSDSDIQDGDELDSASDFGSESFNESDSDPEQDKLLFIRACTIVIYGKSQCGKSQFIADLILGRHFSPMPEQYYLLTNTSNAVDPLKKVEPLLATLETVEGLESKDVHVSSTIAEFKQQAANSETEGSRLVIIDDFCTQKVDPAILSVVNELVHHHKFYCLITVQSLFIRDGPSLRDAANYIILFPGVYEKRLTVFLRDLPESVLKTAIKHLSTTAQKFQEGAGEDHVYVPCPIIIDRSMHKAEIIVYRGLHDNMPFKSTCDELSATTGATGREVTDYVEKRLN